MQTITDPPEAHPRLLHAEEQGKDTAEKEAREYSVVS